MLVLSRKTDEKIMIGDSIVITVVAVSRDKVRLGIEAPKEVPVHRQEVYEAIQKSRQSHAGDAPSNGSETANLSTDK